VYLLVIFHKIRSR